MKASDINVVLRHFGKLNRKQELSQVLLHSHISHYACNDALEFLEIYVSIRLEFLLVLVKV